VAKPGWSEPVRILVLGAGVIGSVYAGKLLQAGHHVEVLARGRRLVDLQSRGLVLEDAESKQCVRLPILRGLNDGSDVLFLGNLAGHGSTLIEALGQRVVFGFPAAGGFLDGAVTRYVLISRQKTTLGEQSGAKSSRLRGLKTMFTGAGFPTTITANVDGWLLGHAAFVVPMAFALYRADTDAGRLADDAGTLRLMVRGTRQAFQALRVAGIGEIPTNLTILYRMPERFVTHYWRRVLASPRGELWFAAHSRAARQEMTCLADDLQAAVHHTGHQAPDLDALLSRD
jgi:2-dehydropantoate 2-reductase